MIPHSPAQTSIKATFISPKGLFWHFRRILFMFHWLFFFIIIYQNQKTCSHPLFCCFSSYLPSRSSPTAPPIPSRSFKVNPLSFRHHYSFSSRYSPSPKWCGFAVLQRNSVQVTPARVHLARTVCTRPGERYNNIACQEMDSIGLCEALTSRL